MSRPVKIALIDDDKDLVDSLKHFLERRSYAVSAAFGGRQGLEVIKSQVPDVIILDMMMPDLDGIGVLTEVKKDESTRDIPVIMLTAKDTQTDRLSALELGAYEYVAKPLDTHMLVRQIENVLRKKKEGTI